MLKKLRILIYKNWFSVLASFLISFLSLKNIFFGILLAFFLYWQIRGSLSQTLFFSFIFVPLLIVLIKKIEISNFYLLILFGANYLALKKYLVIDWSILALVLFAFGYFNFSQELGLAAFIIFSSLVVFFYSWSILKYQFFKSLILALIAFELIFIINFLPFSFLWRIVILISLIFLILKFADVIIKQQWN